MPYYGSGSHEGSQNKYDYALEGRGWKPAKRRRFHDWLAENYPYEKDDLSTRRLSEVADEFARQDTDRWDD